MQRAAFASRAAGAALPGARDGAARAARGGRARRGVLRGRAAVAARRGGAGGARGLRRAAGGGAAFARVTEGVVRAAGRARFRSRVDVLVGVVARLRARVVAAAVQEVEGVEPGAVVLSGFLYVEAESARLYGDVLYSGRIERVACSPVVAVSLSDALGKPCYMERALADVASVLVTNMAEVLEAPGKVPVRTENDDNYDGNAYELQSSSSSDTQSAQSMQNAIWEMKAADVIDMADSALRDCLQRNDVGVTSSESHTSLMRKFIGLMDEAERRELGIMLAADSELYGLAAELQASRSKRGQLTAEMREAEKKGDWNKVFRLNEKINLLLDQTADCTAEPGSYDPYLDCDEWYKPNR